MKDGYIFKAAQPKPDEIEMEQINRFTRRKLLPEEVYTFSVILCDNEIDRDMERFSIPALKRLAELFVGKPGIFDHSMKGSDQTARIYSCEVEQVDGRKTKAGEDYCRLKAKAYMPVTEKNSDMRMELDSGIKKEVSVGCAVQGAYCSVCGADKKKKGCSHVKGKTYPGHNCVAHVILDEPSDAYEWSFVAVPAQMEAGVVKSFVQMNRGGENVEQVIERIQKSAGEVCLDHQETVKLLDYISQLREKAELGEAYRMELRKEVLRLNSMIPSAVPGETMEQLTKKMTISELKSFREAFTAQAEERKISQPQLAPRTEKKVIEGNHPFQI